MLTDAIYFKARWQTVFGKYGPVDGEFTMLDGTKVPTTFMQELELADRRGRGTGFVGAEIPYAGDQYSMLVIVPREGRFADVRDRLGQDLLDEIDRTFTTGPYELQLPKWKNTSNLDLLPWLEELGVAPGAYPQITPRCVPQRCRPCRRHRGRRVGHGGGRGDRARVRGIRSASA